MNSIASRFGSLHLNNFSERFSYDRLSSDVGSFRSRISSIKPLQDFFDIRRMSKPNGWIDAQQRIHFNLSYFSTNYIIIFLVLSIYALLTNPMLLYVIILIIGGLFAIGLLKGQDLNTPFGTITNTNLYTILFIIAAPLLLFSSPIGTLLWLLGASGVTILSHGALMEKPIESEFAEQV